MVSFMLSLHSCGLLCDVKRKQLAGRPPSVCLFWQCYRHFLIAKHTVGHLSSVLLVQG